MNIFLTYYPCVFVHCMLLALSTEPATWQVWNKYLLNEMNEIIISLPMPYVGKFHFFCMIMLQKFWERKCFSFRRKCCTYPVLKLSFLWQTRAFHHPGCLLSSACIHIGQCALYSEAVGSENNVPKLWDAFRF